MPYYVVVSIFIVLLVENQRTILLIFFISCEELCNDKKKKKKTLFQLAIERSFHFPLNSRVRALIYEVIYISNQAQCFWGIKFLEKLMSVPMKF